MPEDPYLASALERAFPARLCERYRERRKSDTMRAFDRLVRDRVPAEAGLVH